MGRRLAILLNGRRVVEAVVMSDEEERILRRLVEVVAERYGVDVSVAEIGG